MRYLDKFVVGAGVAVIVGGAMLMTSVAHADPASKRYVLRAEVVGFCAISAPEVEEIYLTINNGLPDTTPINLSTEISCNSPVNIKTSSYWGGLMLESDYTDPIFQNHIDYTAFISVSGVSQTSLLDTRTAQTKGQELGAPDIWISAGHLQQSHTIDLVVTPTALPDGSLLPKGSYSDAITIELVPET